MVYFFNPLLFFIEKNISIVFTPNLLRSQNIQFGIADMNSFSMLAKVLENYEAIKPKIETPQTLFLPDQEEC